jgi:hypothetical protein
MQICGNQPTTWFGQCRIAWQNMGIDFIVPSAF